MRSLDQPVAYVRLAERIIGAEWVTPEHFRIGASGLLDELVCILAAPDDSVFGEPEGPRRTLPHGGERSAAKIGDFVAGLT